MLRDFALADPAFASAAHYLAIMHASPFACYGVKKVAIERVSCH